MRPSSMGIIEKRGVTSMDKDSESYSTARHIKADPFVRIIVLALVVFSAVVLATDQAAAQNIYNLTFSNLTLMNATRPQGGQAGFNISIFNEENLSRDYNLSINFIGSSATATLNSTDPVNITNGSLIHINVLLNSTAVGVFPFELVATLSNDTSVVLNSTEDLFGVFYFIVSDSSLPWFIQVPTDQVVEYGQPFAYKINASDNVAVDRFEVNNSAFSIDTTGNLTNGSLLTLGIHSLNISVNDTSGNRNHTLFSVTVQDTTDPTWNESPNNITLELSDPLSYDLNASDLAGLGAYAVSDIQNFSIDASTGVLADAVTLSVYNYTLVVTVNDTSGNTINEQVVVTVTDTRPPATITGLTNLSRSSSWLYWNWTNPSDGDFNGTMVYIDGALNATLGSSINYFNHTGLPNVTSYTITVHTLDTHGLFNTTDVNTTWSTTENNRAPTVTLTDPNSQRNITGVFSINATVSDEDGNDTIQAVWFWLSLDGGGTWDFLGNDTYDGDVNYIVLYNSTNVTYNSNVTFFVNATDGFEIGSDMADANVTLDNYAPSVGLVQIELGVSFTTNSTLDFSWVTGSDIGSGIKYYYFNITDYSGRRNGTPVAVGTTTSQLIGAPEGDVYIYVWAEDYAGNIGVAQSDSILVDTVSPVVSILWPADGQLINDATPTIQLNFSDARLNTSSLSVTVNNTGYDETNMTCSGTLSSYLCNLTISADMEDNINISLQISAYDDVLLSNSTSSLFSLNTYAPFYNFSTTAATSATITASNLETYTFNGSGPASSANMTGTVQENYTFYNYSSYNTLRGGAVSLLGPAVAANGTTDAVTWTSASTGTAGNSIAITLTNLTTYVNVTITNGTLTESWRYYNDSAGLNITTWQHVVWAVSGSENTSASVMVTASLTGSDADAPTDSATLSGGLESNTYLGAGYIMLNGQNISWAANMTSDPQSTGTARAQIINAISATSAQSNVTGVVPSGDGILLNSTQPGASYPVTVTHADTQSGLSVASNATAVARNNRFAMSFDGDSAVYFNLTSGINRTGTEVAAEIDAAIGNNTASAVGGYIFIQANSTNTSSSIEVVAVNQSAYDVLGFVAGTVTNGSDSITARNIFNFTVDGAAYTVYFEPVGISLSASNLSLQIDSTVAGVASDASGRLRLTSPTAAGNSSILIFDGTANLELGFSDYAVANGTPLTYDFVGVSETEMFTGNTIYVWGNVSDDSDVGLAFAWLEKNTSSTRYDITALSGSNDFINISYIVQEEDVGSFNLTLHFNDTYGNENTSPAFSLFAVDAGAPLILMTSPSNNSLQNNSYISLIFNASEATPLARFCVYNLTNSSGGQASSGVYTSADASLLSGVTYHYESNILNIPNGEYVLWMNCTDNASRTRTVWHNLTLNDSTPPAGAVTSESSGTTTVNFLITVTTDEDATCKYHNFDVNFSSMPSYMSGNGTSHTLAVEFQSDASGTYYFLCNDSAGNVMPSSLTKAYSITVASSNGTTTAAGGGGGGGGGGPPSIEGMSVSKVWNELTVADGASMTIESETIPITSLAVTLNNDIDAQVEIKVIHLTAAPDLQFPFEGTVYKFIKIEESGISETDIDSVLFAFKVEKAYLENKSWKQEDVVLWRYEIGDGWKALDTKAASEDSAYIHFEATSPGLSFFLISTKESTDQGIGTGDDSDSADAADDGTADDGTDGVGDDEADRPELVDGGGDQPTPEVTSGLKDASKSGSAVLWIVIVVLVFVALGLFVVYFRRPKPIEFSEEERLKIDQELDRHGVHVVHGELDKLEDYIASGLKSGRSKEEVRSILLNTGWKADVIDKLLEKR
ncbi:MAG: PGF-pre-PGF domain-containing protein [archaeon]